MIFLDTETFNERPIKHGTYVYTSTCEPMIVTYAHNDQPVSLWDRTAQPNIPEYLEYLLMDTDDVIVAHNAMFDRNVLRYGLKIDTDISRWRCNMVRALVHALPGGLDILCDIWKVPESARKVKEGKRLVKLFCQPQRFSHDLNRKAFASKKLFDAAVEELRATWTGRATRHTHPAEWAEFCEYAKGDILSMRWLDSHLPVWNYQGEELDLYHLDQKINDRGFLVDVELATGAVRAVTEAKARLKEQTQANTGYDAEAGTGVESATKRDKLLMYLLAEHGVDLPDLTKSTLERRIQDPNLPEGLRELLAIRLQASSTSSTKYQSLLNGVMDDHRLRGTLQFSGAARTRRWAGRTFQPQNLPSRGLPKHELIEIGIDAMKGGYEDLIFDDVMGVAAGAVRGCIIAPPKRRLVIADLANIEGRDCAWLAGEEWKLQAFRDFDTVLGTDGKWHTGPEFYAAARRHEYIPLEMDRGEPVRKGPDLYKLAYAKSFHIRPEDVQKHQRQIGKVMELMLQYEGGVGAFVTGALGYNIDLEDLANVAWDTLPGDVVYEATNFLDWVRKEKRQTFGLSDKAFVTCDSLKRLWRRAHPAITSLWPEMKNASIKAIENPGNTVAVRKFKFRRDGSWFRIGLPSGRSLCYPQPQVKGGVISYMGVNQYTRQWGRLGTYGGKELENSCQAIAGDVLKANMPLVESEGYDIVLTVHDEAVTEAPDLSGYNEMHLSSLLAAQPGWAPDMPLAAAGFTTYRYRKD